MHRRIRLLKSQLRDAIEARLERIRRALPTILRFQRKILPFQRKMLSLSRYFGLSPKLVYAWVIGLALPHLRGKLLNNSLLREYGPRSLVHGSTLC